MAPFPAFLEKKHPEPIGHNKQFRLLETGDLPQLRLGLL